MTEPDWLTVEEFNAGYAIVAAVASNPIIADMSQRIFMNLSHRVSPFLSKTYACACDG
jgi:hypothetical protein